MFVYVWRCVTIWTGAAALDVREKALAAERSAMKERLAVLESAKSDAGALVAVLQAEADSRARQVAQTQADLKKVTILLLWAFSPRA